MNAIAPFFSPRKDGSIINERIQSCRNSSKAGTTEPTGNSCSRTANKD